MQALILFYLKKEAKNIDEFAKYWGYIKYLSSQDLLGVSTIPLKLS
jgi:hypothetical protein